MENQAHIISAIKTSLEKGRLGHALLFQGAAGTGPLEVAAVLARLLFCENLKNADPCGACRQCRLVGQNTHPDFVKVSPLEDSEVIKINQIRELITRANLKPFEARSKVFVVEPADAMNEEAQNAFLKTLEEPQGNTRFILITQGPSELLETIRSRCQAFHFAPSRTMVPEDEEFQALKQVALEIFLSKGPHRAAAFPDLSKFEREEASELLDVLMQYFRDCLLIRVGADAIVSVEEELVRKRRLAAEWTETELQDRIEFLSDIKEKVMNKVNLRLAAAVLWEAVE